MKRNESERLFKKACKLIPGGVNSPVRAFRSVNDIPFYVRSAQGACLTDVDGNSYVDYVASWGAVILGHADAGLVGETVAAVYNGSTYGACHPYEIELAELITGAFPSMEMVRLVSSGTEATMSAVRLARGFTGKDGVVKFRGCYHGHADSMLVKAGSGLATLGTPDSAGVPADFAKHTYIAEFNNADSLAKITRERQDIACVIVEPVMGNMGVIPPKDGFLHDLREICSSSGIILIFDEVITGFRVAYGGAQQLFGVRPDITCLGKIIGGGFPIGAFGGRREIMEQLAPLGDIYQAGTLSGNPVAVRAGIHVVKYLRDHGEAYEEMVTAVRRLKGEVEAVAERESIPYRVNGICGMFTGFFTDEDVTGYEQAMRSDRGAYEFFFKNMLEEHIFFAPSQFEAAFVTLAHGEKEKEKTIDACKKVFKKMRSAR